MPYLTAEAALALAARYWRVSGEIRPLPSYDDQNFRICTANGDYVLKVANPVRPESDLDLENQAMQTLVEREPSLHWPKAVRGIDGGRVLACPVGAGTCHVRLLTFVPGMTYAEALERTPPGRRATLHESLGRAVGMLSRGLAGFRHPAANRDYRWNLLGLPTLHAEVAGVDDMPLRTAIRECVETFAAQLPGWRAGLPMAVLHNDANDLNVIVATGDNGEGTVSSIIDFGDMCTGLRLCELAIAATYAMQHEADPVECAQRILRGYLAIQALTPAELTQLHFFILARLCQSILLATQAAREQPANPHVVVSQLGVRSLLRRLADVDPYVIVKPFLEATHEP